MILKTYELYNVGATDPFHTGYGDMADELYDLNYCIEHEVNKVLAG